MLYNFKTKIVHKLIKFYIKISPKVCYQQETVNKTPYSIYTRIHSIVTPLVATISNRLFLPEHLKNSNFTPGIRQ